jgi:2-keto-4-pentenoate hydratase
VTGVDVAKLAHELLAALDRGKTIPSIVGRHPGFDWDEGYAVAAEILRLRRARGERTVGRKIGFTNRNIWAEYGATAPIWAHVYDRGLMSSADGRATVSLRGSVQHTELYRLTARVTPRRSLRSASARCKCPRSETSTV